MEDIEYAELIEHCWQRNEKLDKLRSKLHVEALKMMHELKRLDKDEPQYGVNLEQRGLLQLLNYLVVDYFDWYGYTSTLKTFSIETGEKTRPKPREKLQRELGGSFDNIELPILLQMLLKETNSDNDELLDSSYWQHIPTSRKKLKKETSADEKPSKKQRKHKPNLLVEQIKAEKTSIKQLDPPETKKTLKNLDHDFKKPQIKVNVRHSMAAKNS